MPTKESARYLNSAQIVQTISNVHQTGHNAFICCIVFFTVNKDTTVKELYRYLNIHFLL